MVTHDTQGRLRNARGQGARLREEILTAATRIIDEPGSGRDLSLRGIAREAGVTAPSIYAHFADLADIRDEILARSFDELDRGVGRAMDDQDSPETAVIEGCLAYVEFSWRHEARYRFMVAAGGFAPDAVRTFQRVEEALTQCVTRGSSLSTDPHGDTFLLWLGMHGMATLKKPERPQLRRLGALDRRGLARTLAARIAGLAAT